jgi:Fe-S cluster assembly protein SufD
VAQAVVESGLSRQAVEELARQRREPEWLVELRLRAFGIYQSLPVPDTRTEGWRRTSLSGLKLPDSVPSDGPATTWQAPAGVSILPLDDPRAEQHLGKIVSPDADKFTALHYALLNSGVMLYVPRGRAIEEPIWITHRAPFSHTLLVVEDEAEVRLIEEFQGEPGPLASGVVEQVIGRNAQVRYVHLQRWAPEVYAFNWQRATLGADSHLRTLNVAVGARLARNTVQVVLAGRGSQADLLGIVPTDGRQHVDFQTLQDHFGDATRSDLVIHNALRGRSSSNFTGLIRINHTARQTESSQEQKNVLLSAHAKADSDPKLEILNNDVIRCTHGAAVGPVDPELVFYLQSRGLTQQEAERLIVEGFFQSVIAKLEQPRMQEAVWNALEADGSETPRAGEWSEPE